MLIQEFRGESKENRRSPAQLAADYAAVIDMLMPGLSAPNEPDRQEAEQTLEDLCMRAARPGAERNRRALCSAMSARLGPETARPARMWMMRQLARIGKGECVDALAEVLADSDPMVRDAARRALQANPDPSAHAALHHELAVVLNSTGRHAGAQGGMDPPKPRAEDPAWAAALVNALAAQPRREDEAAYSLAALVALSDDQPVLAEAAIRALGRIGAVSFLDDLRNNPDLRAKLAAHDLTGRWVEAQLLAAESLSAGRRTADAMDIYRKLLDDGEPQHVIAALNGLVRAQGEKALPLLMEQMNSAESRARLTAAALACDLTGGEKVTKQLADQLTGLPADVQVRLIDGLATRGGSAARLAVLGLLNHPNRDVRTAAVRAMGKVGQASHVRLLARIASERTGQEQKAARESLTALRDPGFDRAAVFALESSPAPIQAELLKAMKSRQTKNEAALNAAMSLLSSPESSIQIAALDFLGAVANETTAWKLAGLMRLFSDEAVRSAAEDAIVAASQRLPEGQRSAAGLFGLEASDDPERKASFLRILARIGEADGLEAIRKHVSDADPAVKDAAMRALCDWKDAAALVDVQAIMKTLTDPAQRTLAFRAYVRLLKLPIADRTPQTTLAMIDEALTLAKSPDEKKLVFSGMSDLACVEALDRLEAALPDVTLQAEAAVAICGVARAISGRHPDRARSAIERVKSYPVSEAVKKAADEALKHIDRYVGYVTTWQICGPYRVARKEAGDLFDLALGPEPDADPALTPDVPNVEWRPLAITDEKEPWLFDLSKVTAESNCCVYVQATVICPTETAAKLEIGSDDLVKVWLNGQLVHANKAFRPLAVASDTVNVTLKAGANDLMLKVVQGSGGFGVCCGVKAADGSSIPGLKITSDGP